MRDSAIKGQSCQLARFNFIQIILIASGPHCYLIPLRPRASSGETREQENTMTTSPAETTTLGWQSLTTVVTARDTNIDPGITDMSTVEDGVAMLGIVAGTHTGGCNSFTHQSLLSKDTDPFRLDSQFEFSRTYSHQYHYESLMNLAPTGQPFESSYVGFCRIDEGQNLVEDEGLIGREGFA